MKRGVSALIFLAAVLLLAAAPSFSLTP